MAEAQAFIVVAYTHMSELRRNSDALSFFHDQPSLHLKSTYFQSLHRGIFKNVIDKKLE